jgi:hypothetical protein
MKMMRFWMLRVFAGFLALFLSAHFFSLLALRYPKLLLKKK